jgi:hypothetical protein
VPTLIIENLPGYLYDQIQDLAKARHRTPADTVVDVLKTAFRTTQPTFGEAPLPDAPFLTEEICAPTSIPWPEGETVVPIDVAPPLPLPHDIPNAESWLPPFMTHNTWSMSAC